MDSPTVRKVLAATNKTSVEESMDMAKVTSGADIDMAKVASSADIDMAKVTSGVNVDVLSLLGYS